MGVFFSQSNPNNKYQDLQKQITNNKETQQELTQQLQLKELKEEDKQSLIITGVKFYLQTIVVSNEFVYVPELILTEKRDRHISVYTFAEQNGDQMKFMYKTYNPNYFSSLSCQENNNSNNFEENIEEVRLDQLLQNYVQYSKLFKNRDQNEFQFNIAKILGVNNSNLKKLQKALAQSKKTQPVYGHLSKRLITLGLLFFGFATMVSILNSLNTKKMLILIHDQLIELL